MVERSPKFEVVVLTEAQKEQAVAILAERDDHYRRYTAARNALEKFYQDIAGPKREWELDKEGGILLHRAEGLRP